MYLIIDFGLTRAANKVKKKAWEKGLVSRDILKHIRTKRDNLAHVRSVRGIFMDKLKTGRVLGDNKAGREVWTGRNRKDIRGEIGLPKLTRKYKSGEHAPRSTVEKEMILDTKNFTDIRKAEDTHLSRSGYMGFKNTPNSFHEEAIPLVETGKVIKKNKPYIYL